MGRLPKGFAVKKAAAPGSGPQQQSTEDAKLGVEKQQAEAFAAQAKPQSHEPKSKVIKDAHESDDEEGAGLSNLRGRLIQRHKQEMQTFKKAMTRSGKKSKDETTKLTSQLEAKQEKELQEFDAQQHAAPAAVEAEACHNASLKIDAEHADKEAEHVDADAGGAGKMKTKAMKRREKQEAEEAERDARVAAELAAAGPSARAVEEEALAALLAPLRLCVREIRADGHCLYRSLEDQLSLTAASASDPGGEQGAGTSGSGPEGIAAGRGWGVQELRAAAAARMRAHPEDYAAFVHLEGKEDTPSAALERHCSELEGTAAWGGQLELSVLSQVLQRPIRVYSVGLPTVVLGEEFQGLPLQVCYLRHAFGLGEHYNSLAIMTETDTVPLTEAEAVVEAETS